MRLLSGILLLLVASVPGIAQRSALTETRNIAQLSQQAATIVRGQVVSVRVEPHPQLQNLTTVVVTFRVAETLKGDSPAVMTFRQFIWDIRDQYNAAGYRKGQQLLLLLNPTSVYGLTSPSGMDQGRFQVSRDGQGKLLAVNGQGNVGLFSNMSAQLAQPNVKLSAGASALIAQHRNGAVPLSQLEETIRQFAGAGR